MVDKIQYKGFGEDFLDDIINWIGNNLDPLDVFTKVQLTDAVNENYYVDDVFSQNELESWAENNGWEKPLGNNE